jgi:hypothetical protein
MQFLAKLGKYWEKIKSFVTEKHSAYFVIESMSLRLNKLERISLLVFTFYGLQGKEPIHVEARLGAPKCGLGLYL